MLSLGTMRWRAVDMLPRKCGFSEWICCLAAGPDVRDLVKKLDVL